MNTAMSINGIPRLSEYTSSRLNAIAGVVAASVSIVPSIGPMHGVQPAANANPNMNETGNDAFSRRINSFFSMLRRLIFVDSIRNIPKATIMEPPIWFSMPIISQPEPIKMLFINTPIAENTNENPSTKKTALSTMPILFIETFPLVEFFTSVSEIPDMYAKNAGIMGSMQGAKNDPKPASAAIRSVTSTS